MTGKAPLVKGGTHMLTVRLSSGEIHVKVRLLEHRMVFGRSEWRIAPVAGNGATWIQEVSLDAGVTRVAPSEQTLTRNLQEEDMPAARRLASRTPRT